MVCHQPHPHPKVHACFKGHYLGVAVKATRGPGPIAAERRELEKLDRAGAVTLVARTASEVEAVLNDLERNEA